MGDNKYWIDLSGVINLQKNLLTHIGSTVSDGTANLDATMVANINQSLSGLASNLDTASSAIGPTLTYQKEVKTILDRENDRLATRKTAIEGAYAGQKRMVALTNSVTAKNKAYNYMLFIVVLILIVFVGIKFLYTVEGVPHALLDITNIILISLGLIYCVYLYIDIRRRYNMDFNQVSLVEPSKKTPAELARDQEKNVNSGNLYALLKSSNAASGCQGSACCPDGTTFNEKYNVCVPNMVPFDTAGVTTANKDNWKYFATAGSGGVTTYSWRDITSATPAGCGSAANYDSALLACKPVTSGFTNMSSATAEPFSATEYSEYARV
jgi:hypothetical protein